MKKLLKEPSKLSEPRTKEKLHQAQRRMKLKNRDDSGKRNFPPCGTYGKTKHSKDRYWKRAQCNFCKKQGQIERFFKAKQNQYQKQLAQQANFSEDQQEAEESLFVAFQVCESTKKYIYIVDSGYTNNMANDASFFNFLDRFVNTKVRIGNGEIVQAKGKGSISLQTKKCMKLISDVLLTPKLDQNLPSIAQMIKKGYSMVFKMDFHSIYDSHDYKAIEARLENNSFVLNLKYDVFSVVPNEILDCDKGESEKKILVQKSDSVGVETKEGWCKVVVFDAFFYVKDSKLDVCYNKIKEECKKIKLAIKFQNENGRRMVIASRTNQVIWFKKSLVKQAKVSYVSSNKKICCFSCKKSF
ncbi:uncharacterized protein LOC131171172 [Hevea brasiliensis]|uniref:uncharacterized protein LOC131171172 n=1 Tax=Hevea brasiliensis TaxID=3981 RepID=UPI0025E596C4|nr:uncharacterized protein LOC131171172 [Hevea brasiliensis]